jgi:transcription antitermination factor NusG
MEVFNELNISKQWYALYTKPRHEVKAAIEMDACGIKYYLPMVTRVKQWSDRKKRVKEPLIRSYIFVRVSEQERVLALQLNSIIRCVSERGIPAKIPDNQMNNFIRFIQDGYEYHVLNSITKGVKVRIISGPMIGVEGVVIEEPEHKSIAVSIELLNRTIITRIKDEQILEVITEKPIGDFK